MAARKRKPDFADEEGNPTEAALSRGSPREVGWAAEWAAAQGKIEWGPALEAAFQRLAGASHKADPGCLAKRAAVEALDALDVAYGEVFLAAARLVQMEPVWGESVDTAAGLRAAGVQALARMGHEEAGAVATELLADPEANARLGAIRALEQWAGPGADLVLRLKALHGDPEPEVTSEVLGALARMDPDRYVPWVAPWLRNPNDVLTEGAALALGESRHPGALPLLRAAWQSELAPRRRSLLLTPIALLRSDEAFACLLEIVRDAAAVHAAGAVDALRLFAADPQRWAQVKAATAERTEPEIRAALRNAR